MTRSNTFLSIRWKFSILFTVMIIAIVSIICSLQIAGILWDARNEFNHTISSVFSDEYIAEIDAFAATAVKTTEEFDNYGNLISSKTVEDTNSIFKKICEKKEQLEIWDDRGLYLMDSSGRILDSISNYEYPENTPVLSEALSGNQKTGFDTNSEFLAYYLKTSTMSGNDCIIYVHDNNDDFRDYLKRTVSLYIKCLVVAVILCFIMASVLANSMVIPLQKLNQWAKQLSDGKVDSKNDVSGNDEFGALAKTLEQMAKNLEKSSAQTSGEQIKLETILQNMTDGILAFNLDGRIIHINPEAKRLLGIEFLDDISFDSFFKEIQAGISMGDLLYNNFGETIEKDIVLDKSRFLKLNFTTFNINHKIGGIVVVIHDVTRQKKLDQSRRDFVADVSHELRTPLTTIKSYAETLSDTPDAPPGLSEKFLTVIASEAERMARIISDLLTLSELDDKKQVYKTPEPIDVKTMVKSITERMQIDAKRKNQTLVYNPINDVPVIEGNRDGLERVIINIISNAVKYTPEEGRIEVYTSRVYNDICIKVTDNGIGIPAENLPNIFDRFYRVDKARSRGTGGTGLGLAIAKQTIEAEFNGKIKINSEYRKGTEVIITIPVR